MKRESDKEMILTTEHGIKLQRREETWRRRRASEATARRDAQDAVVRGVSAAKGKGCWCEGPWWDEHKVSSCWWERLAYVCDGGGEGEMADKEDKRGGGANSSEAPLRVCQNHRTKAVVVLERAAPNLLRSEG